MGQIRRCKNNNRYKQCTLRPLQLNVLFLGPHRPFVFQFCFENVNLGHVTFGSRDLTAVPCAMAALLSTFCWPSVTIKCGTQVLVRRKVVKAECEDTFGEVLERVDPSFVGNSVVRVVTSKNERFLDPIHEVPLNAPIILSEQYGNNVCYYLLEEDTSTPRYIQIYMSYMYMHILIPVRNNNALFLCRTTLSGRNAFEIMMTSHPIELQYFSATLVHFPPVCFWCGAPEETLIRDAIYTEKERNFQTVHAICMFCRSEGKQEFTRHPLNAPKRRKT